MFPIWLGCQKCPICLYLKIPSLLFCLLYKPLYLLYLYIPSYHLRRFLVSFMVDARGGAMHSTRYPGMRVVIPPRAASMPTRVTCRLLRRERLAHLPALSASEGFAARILEVGPTNLHLNVPVLIEVPHYASLRGEREIFVYRSDNGEKWMEHSLEATDQAVRDALGNIFGGSPLFFPFA